MMKDLLDYFKENDTESRKTVYALLIVRSTVKNPMTADQFATIFVHRHDGAFDHWSFNCLEDMMEFIGSSLTLGFGEESPDWIESRLWEEVVRYQEEMKK